MRIALLLEGSHGSRGDIDYLFHASLKCWKNKIGNALSAKRQLRSPMIQNLSKVLRKQLLIMTTGTGM